MTTLLTLTNEQIHQLAFEADAAGDAAMARICAKALAGSESACRSVVAAIQNAEAQENS